MARFVLGLIAFLLVFTTLIFAIPTEVFLKPTTSAYQDQFMSINGSLDGLNKTVTSSVWSFGNKLDLFISVFLYGNAGIDSVLTTRVPAWVSVVMSTINILVVMILTYIVLLLIRGGGDAV